MKRVFLPYRGKGLDNFDILNPILQDAVDKVKTYVVDWGAADGLPEGFGIIFVGPSGVGKTRLACYVLEAMAAKGAQIECIEVSSYVGLHQDAWSRQRAEQWEEWAEVKEHLDFIRNRARFLLLDDLGREHESVSGWSNEQMFDLLRYRWNRGKPTIITTNLPYQSLTDRYTEGFTSFLSEITIPIVMEGEDYRRKKGS